MKLLILSVVSYAQNQFVYIRYNPKHGNASAIVRTIDNIMEKSSGKIILFVSQAASPIIATNNFEWKEMRSGLLRMQTAYEYFAEEESVILNQYYTTLFSESVDNNLHIYGEEDKSWACTFIISEEMLHSENFEALAESISVNELASRMSVDILTYNESQHLTPAEIATNTMFKYNISE